MLVPSPTNTLKTWAIADRPREKALNKGSKNLSTAELIAILLGSGSKDETAVGLAQRLLHAYHYDLSLLTRTGISELCKFKGIGKAKAIAIQAALELGQRQNACPVPKNQILDSKDAYQTVRQHLIGLGHEEFWIILLNQGNYVECLKQISMGGINKTCVDARIIFKHALEVQATSMVLCHNHPSGRLVPSKQDIQLTQKLAEAGKYMDILILDHLIIGDNEYYSFADEGQLN